MEISEKLQNNVVQLVVRVTRGFKLGRFPIFAAMFMAKWLESGRSWRRSFVFS